MNKIRVASLLAGLLWAAVDLLSPASTAAESKLPAPIKISEYDRAEYCDLAIGADGVLHAIFTDQPSRDKPKYLYYRASTDEGKTWSAPANLSDDESGNDASYARLVLDGAGRLYAVWKYVARGALLDGPGGTAPGRIVFRAWSNGTWSKRVALGEPRIPMFSWFAAVGPDGAVHLAWSQVLNATPASYFVIGYANLVREALLDGAAVKSVKDLVSPRPLLTEAQIKEMRAAGKPVNYQDTLPAKQGLVNLRGFIDAKGTIQFVAERPGIEDGPSSQQTGKQIVIWDGVKFASVYAFEKFATYNNFNNPPALVSDASGKLHLIRAPEKSEKPCVRDYPVDGGELGDPVTIIIPSSGPGKLVNWQVHPLAAGKVAVTAALSEKGGWDPDDVELYLSLFDGKESWAKPICLTRNQSRAGGSSRETVAGNAIGVVSSHKPRFASVALGKSGRPYLLMIDNEDTIVGMTSPALTTGGRVVSGVSSIRTDSPAVYFLRP